MKFKYLACALALTVGNFAARAESQDANPSHVIEVAVSNKTERTRLANLGFALDELHSDHAYILGNLKDLKRIQSSGFTANAYDMKPEWLALSQGQQMKFEKDGSVSFVDAYQSYDEVSAILTKMATDHGDIVTMLSLGKSFEGRDIPLMRISGKTLQQAEDAKLPVAFYMGCHHAREPLSVEVPLMFAQYLVDNYAVDADVKRLVDTREIYVAPIINPDGYVYDRSNGKGRLWRKNRSHNADGTSGVDLNRNYGFHWGEGGSSKRGSDETYMGPQPFSEPETQQIRDFVLTQPRMTTLLSLHTYSELILYPWGHTDDKIGDKIGNKADLPVFEKMANTMAEWNHYTPEQSSELYIASGDTTDWAYGERGIFAFTIELTPTTMFNGGFYPNPRVIQPTFDANLKPMLYLLEFSDDPARVLTEKTPNFLTTPAKRGIATANFGDVTL